RGWVSTVNSMIVASSAATPAAGLPGHRPERDARDASLISVADGQLFRREKRNHAAALVRHHDLLFDAGGGIAVGRRAIRLQREHHAFLDLGRMIERDDARDDRPLVQREPEAMPELQAERRHLVGEAELLRLGPYLADLVR